jgi:hypothetical protein
MTKQLGRWRSTDLYGASDFIGATPRPDASLRQISDPPPQKAHHIWFEPTRTAPAATRRRRTRDAEDPEGRQSWNAERSGGVDPAKFGQPTQPEESAGFNDQDPIGARLQPGISSPSARIATKRGSR